MEFKSDEKLCEILSDPTLILWNFDWIKDPKLKKMAQSYSLIDGTEVEELNPEIQDQEFDAFWVGYN